MRHVLLLFLGGLLLRVSPVKALIPSLFCVIPLLWFLCGTNDDDSSVPTIVPTSAPVSVPSIVPTSAPAAPLARNCCGYDFTCHDYGSGDNFCNQSAEYCEGPCNGFYIDSSLTQDCTPLWQSCSADDDCCSGGVATICFAKPPVGVLQCLTERCCAAAGGDGTCMDDYDCNHSAGQCTTCGGTWTSRRSG